MQEDTKNTSYMLLLIVLVVLVVGGVYVFLRTQVISPSEPVTDEREVTMTDSPDVVVMGEDVDVEKTTLDYIKDEFNKKYDRPVEEIDVSITEERDGYAIGNVSFEGEMGGGIFLVAKVDDFWKLVFDGNGIPDCKSLDEVNFPADMMNTCWDEANLETVDRTVLEEGATEETTPIERGAVEETTLETPTDLK